MNRMQRTRALWIAIVALAAAPLVFTPHTWVGSAPRASTRLIAPLLPLVASVQWVRVDAAMRTGRPQLALARAETLFELEPRSGEAREFVALYLAGNVASPEREPDPARRAAWLRAAIDVLAGGEELAAAPADLALWAGKFLEVAAENDTDIAWPGGVGGLWREAAECYARAVKLGHPLGAERLAYALERAKSDR